MRHFGYKAMSVAVNRSNFGKTTISKDKGVMCDFKNIWKNFTYLAENTLFCVVSVYAEQFYLPNNGPIINFYKALIFKHK